jgi:glycerol kinase
MRRASSEPCSGSLETQADVPYILAIDQGTSSTKTVVFDAGGAITASASVGLECSFPRPGFVEQDPEAIYRSVIESVRRCLESFKEHDGDPADIASCGISNQRETFLLWNKDGKPLGDAVSWQCERSAEICSRLRAGALGEEVSRRTGLLITPYFSATKLLWLLENDAEIRRAVRRGGVRFGTIDTWLLWCLTRGSTYATDHTNASRTLLFNIDDLNWDEHLRETWNISELMLPSSHPSVHPYGETDFEGAFPGRIRIDAMIGDSHAAAFGERCFTPGMVKATMGTGSSLLMEVGETRCQARAGIVSTICWSLPGNVHYALEGIIVSCGATIAWLRDQLGLIADSAETEAVASSVPDNGGVYLVPAFSGLGSPRWKSNLRASILGLTFSSGRAHVVRAALESIPYQIADVLAAMQEASGMKPVELRVDGGMTTNTLVMQLLADVADVPVVNVGFPEVSALGAAMLAGLGAGLYRSLDELPPLPSTVLRYRAGPGASRAREDYAEWGRVLARLP